MGEIVGLEVGNGERVGESVVGRGEAVAFIPLGEGLDVVVGNDVVGLIVSILDGTGGGVLSPKIT